MLTAGTTGTAIIPIVLRTARHVGTSAERGENLFSGLREQSGSEVHTLGQGASGVGQDEADGNHGSETVEKPR